MKTIMARMKDLTKYMNEKQRLQFANTYLISKLKYGAHFLVGETFQVQQQYHAATMSVARWVKQNYCFKVSCLKICKSLQ